MRSSSRCQSPASSSMMRIMRGDSTSERLARMLGNSVRRKRGPCRTATPRSSRKARIWLMMPVRWPDQPFTHPVQRLQVELLGCLGGDEFHRRALYRLGDRFAVAEIVLLPFAYARTYFAGISRAS